MLSTSPSFPISSYLHMPSPTAAVAAAAAAATSLATQTAKAYDHNLAPQPPRVLYRLAAVVCHYGQHSFGHYVCFRRRPRGSGRIGPPRLDEVFPAVPGRGWLRASDDAVREVGIETVLQEGSGAFMLYYERVRNKDKPSAPAWSPHSRAATDDDNDDNDDAGEIDGAGAGASGGGGQEEKARTYRSQDVVKSELGEEVEETPVIKARVVRSVSLGRGDDFEGASGSVEKGEKGEEDPDSSPRPAKPEHVEVEPTVELLPTSAVSTALSPIPAMDEPPIGAVPPSADHRA